ncbi:hypothetical protein GCM10025791_11400 [Halioxenophilus aromaticivorans]|uniref:Uncharacterized protein n=1 Tax=Halioxenophilus aromaticivorans TaxID=1306992 RepID=A0AAV3TZ08_9ALTE
MPPWLTQAKAAELFGSTRVAIANLVSDIFKSEGLADLVVGSIMEHTTIHGAVEFRTKAEK